MYRFVSLVAKWAVAVVAVLALVRVLTLKSMFSTTSGFLTTELGVSDYAALPVATLLAILGSALMGPLIAYLIFGRKPLQALVAGLILTLCVGALGFFNENLAPERVFMCRPEEMLFFTRKGASKIFYAKLGDRYEFFNRPGTHPQRGVDLQAVTPRLAGVILDSAEAGETLATRRECELQRLAALRRDTETQHESSRSYGDRLLSWMGVGHPDPVSPGQPAPRNSGEVTGILPAVETGQASHETGTGTRDQDSAYSTYATNGADATAQGVEPPSSATTAPYNAYLAVTPDRQITAFAVEGEHPELARELMQNQLSEGEALSFSGRFRTDGLFARAFSGEPDAIADLHLPPNVSRVVLARSNVTRTENQALHGVVRVTYAIEARILDSATGATIETRQFSAQGVGFSDKTAWGQLRERLANGT